MALNEELSILDLRVERKKIPNTLKLVPVKKNEK